MASSSLQNHWYDMPEWRPGRHLLALYLTFANHPDLHATVADYQRELAGLPGVDLVDPRWLHLTLQGIAFTDELDGRAEAIGEALHEKFAGWALPALEAHPPIIDRDAIALPVTPKGEMHELKHAIEAAAAQACGGEPYRLPEPRGGFDPHISIAYGSQDVPGELIRARTERVDHPPLLLPVTHLSLIELRRDVPRWHWRTERRIPLAVTGARTGARVSARV